jgi:hypothetical protein
MSALRMMIQVTIAATHRTIARLSPSWYTE